MSIPEPATLALTAAAGEPFSQELCFKSAPSNAPLDLSTHRLRSQLRQGDGTTLAGEFAVTAIDAVAGRFLLELDAQAVDALPAESLWDLLVIDPGGTERIWLRGSLTVS